jgi:hypothetical protein
MTQTLATLKPRDSVLNGTEDFVVNLSNFPEKTESEAREFLDSNVVTKGMALLLEQVALRFNEGRSRAIYKLSEAMGGGKTQSLIVLGCLSKFPQLAPSVNLEDFTAPDEVITFSGRETDKNFWISIGKQLGVDLDSSRAPSEMEWAKAINNRKVLILLDEMAFYLVHAASCAEVGGKKLSTLTTIALTNLFGAIRDHKEAKGSCAVVADLEKDWHEGAEELNKVLASDDMLRGNMNSLNNEMTKGAMSISPVDSSSDELYDILRKRLFTGDLSDSYEVQEAYVDAFKIAQSTINLKAQKIRERVATSYPFHFSTRALVAEFNDNPRFQKTRDVIRLMAEVIRDIWSRGQQENLYLISLADADLNNPQIASKFMELKPALRDMLATDLANEGKSKVELEDEALDGKAIPAAKWVFVHSLAVVHPRGLKTEELIENMVAPGFDLTGMSSVLEVLHKTCWYLEVNRLGRYYFNKEQNLNAMITRFVDNCGTGDCDLLISDMLTSMFTPTEKSCYQRLEVLPQLDKIRLTNPDETTLIIYKPETDINFWFDEQLFKNRVMFLTTGEASMLRIQSRAKRIYALTEIMNDLGSDHVNYKKASTLRTDAQTDLFLTIRSIYSNLLYPLWVPSSGKTVLKHTSIKDNFNGNKYEFSQASKGEFVVLDTLKEVNKFQTVDLKNKSADTFKMLRSRAEQVIFPKNHRISWTDFTQKTAKQGNMTWTAPKTMELMKEVLITEGIWREESGLICGSKAERATSLYVEHKFNENGDLNIESLQKFHGDQVLYRTEDSADWKPFDSNNPPTISAMKVELKCIDSTGQNTEGRAIIITNEIELQHELKKGTTDDTYLLTVSSAPQNATIQYSNDGSDPVNSGVPYPTGGITAPCGSIVSIVGIQDGIISKVLKVSIPDANTEEESPVEEEDAIDESASLDLKGNRNLWNKLELQNRASVSQFLIELPASTHMDSCRLLVTDTVENYQVVFQWQRVQNITIDQLNQAFAFLDTQCTGGEWTLEFSNLKFHTGADFLEWTKTLKFGIATELWSQN